MSTRPLRSRVVIGIIAAVIVGGLAAFAVLVLSTTSEVVETANTFMKAMTEGRTSEAWSLCSREMQNSLKGEENLARIAVRSGGRLAGWSFGRKRVVEFYATLPLKLSWSDGSSTRGSLHLARLNEVWRVTGIETDKRE